MSNIILPAGGDDAYQIQRSVRFRSSATATFTRTPASSGDRQKFTVSFWVKRGVIGGADLFHGNTSNVNGFLGSFRSDHTLYLYDIGAASGGFQVYSARVFRDPSAWYHIVIAVDTTQATDTNRIKVYINGVQENLATWTVGAGASRYPSLNANFDWNNTNQHRIGYAANNGYFDGYLTEVNNVSGFQLDATSFGETDPITGVWKPKKYSGTYGTNGFYLNFSDPSAATAAALGKDSSGNSNNWTPNNVSVTAGVTYDSMLDVPTLNSETNANYAVMSPITGTTNLSNGNLYLTGAGAYRGGYGSIALPDTGKWYWEGLYVQATNNLGLGLAVIGSQTPIAPLTGTGAIGFNNAGQWWVESASTTSTGNPGWTATTVVGMRYDASTGEFSYTSNGSTWTTIVTGTSRFAGRTWVPAAWCFATNDQITLNFGQRPFTYTPPTGFKALNTFNLPDSTISNGATQFAATTYTGTGSARSIDNTVNGKSFQSDLVWVKARSAAYDSQLTDSVRGVNKELQSSGTAAEQNYGTVTAFNNNGFSVGTGASSNQNGVTYVGWQWKEGATSGFDIVSQTLATTGINTLNHSLSAVPKMIIAKRRDAAEQWLVYHASGTTQSQYLGLNTTAASTTSANLWGSSALNASQFYFSGTSGNQYVFYLFADVAGFSKFGSYTGNGSTDGPFVYLGFRPKFVMTKRTDSGTASDHWLIKDSTRSSSNIANNNLYPNLSNAEDTVSTVDIDIVSNGFKIRGTYSGLNASGGTFVYAAFAENPFKNALAR